MLDGIRFPRRFEQHVARTRTTTVVTALVLGHGASVGCGAEEASEAQAVQPSLGTTEGTSIAGAPGGATSAPVPPPTVGGPQGAGGSSASTPPQSSVGGASGATGMQPVAGGGPPVGGASPSAFPSGGSGGTAANDSSEDTSAGTGTGTSGAATTADDTDTTAPDTPSSNASRSPGCGNSPGLESGRHTIDVGGAQREYIIALPQNYDSDRAHRLVFAWHPLGGSAQQVAGMGQGGYYGLQGQDDGSAIFVAPEGLPFNGNNLGWGNNDGRDIAFLDAMFEHFREQLCIDEAQVFSTGFSFGGMMSFAVGCARGEIFRAIAPMAGNIAVSGCENGDLPVAVMGFHGDDDTVVNISGGRAGRDVFVERNGCSQDAEPLEPSWCSELGQDRQPCSCVSYSGCDAGYPVIWCEFNGPHTPAPNSAATIWDFFLQFSDD